MHISIENLGPLSKAEFDLKPLTVFIGNNRQGKSQALYLVTSLLETYGLNAYIENYLADDNLRLLEIDSLYNAFIENGQASIDIVAFFKEQGQNYLNKLSTLAPKYTNKILGTAKSNYNNLKLTYTLSKRDCEQCCDKLFRYAFESRYVGLGINIIKEANSRDIFIYKSDKYSEKTPSREIINHILQSILSPIHLNLINSLVYFPSERVGVSLIIQMLSNIGLQSFVNASEKNPFGLSMNTVSYPVQHFIGLLLLYCLRDSHLISDTLKRNETDGRTFSLLADLLTKKIIGEKVFLADNDPEVIKEILVEVDGKIIDLSAASSGVKGMMGLVLYLQNIAEKGNLVVIDEPELNLHPTQQASFVEFLALLVNNGLKVAITTHSPYIVEHLQNLILANDLNDKSDIVEKLYLKREDAFIAKEDVGIYLFENGTTENILLNDGSINWQTFCDTANDIENVETAIYRQKRYEEENRNSSFPCKNVAEHNPTYK
ncbi:MAG: AAA family ATPase [Paludibacter sp.]|jgi:predicted ATPase|nr:AAA family ATPase [Paludibacter sp.]